MQGRNCDICLQAPVVSWGGGVGCPFGLAPSGILEMATTRALASYSQAQGKTTWEGREGPALLGREGEPLCPGWSCLVWQLWVESEVVGGEISREGSRPLTKLKLSMPLKATGHHSRQRPMCPCPQGGREITVPVHP